MVLSQGVADACRLPLCIPQLTQLFTVESARDRVYVRLTSDPAEVAKQLGSVQEGHRFICVNDETESGGSADPRVAALLDGFMKSLVCVWRRTQLCVI